MVWDADVARAMFVCLLAACFTALGALATVGKNHDNPRLLSFGLSFAGGAMIYISLIEIFGKSYLSFGEAFADKTAYGLATLAFFSGVVVMVLLDHLVPNPHNPITHDGAKKEKGDVKRAGLLAALAITLHNFPEGMATFFATLDDPVVGLPLAIAIAVHNIPEGISIAIPIYVATGSRKSALLATMVSALAEPVGALIGYAALSQFLTPTTYGVTFGMIAGAMVFLALDELLPTAKRYSTGHETTYGMVLGMMALALSLVLFK